MSKAIDLKVAGVRATLLQDEVISFPSDLRCRYCRVQYIRSYDNYYIGTFNEWLVTSEMVKQTGPNEYELVCLNCQNRWEIDQVCPTL